METSVVWEGGVVVRAGELGALGSLLSQTAVLTSG